METIKKQKEEILDCVVQGIHAMSGGQDHSGCALFELYATEILDDSLSVADFIKQVSPDPNY